jgi:hypothetical protein
MSLANLLLSASCLRRCSASKGAFGFLLPIEHGSCGAGSSSLVDRRA